MTSRAPVVRGWLTGLAAMLASCDTSAPPPGAPRASGYVEATDVRVASRVAGRLASVTVGEGQKVEAGSVVATIATTELDLAIGRARAEREQAVAQLRLVDAGSRIEDIRQAEATLSAARSDRATVATELAAARVDEARFTQLVEKRAGSEKQKDDAVVRRALTEARLRSADDRIAAAEAALDRLRAGARVEEVAAARARVAAADAAIAILVNDRAEATIRSPTAGVVTARLAEPGELVPAGGPILTVVDLDRAWATAFVEEPVVPTLRLGQPAEIVTDAGDRLPGTLAFISPRAEFTPRTVQTAAERAKLVYRVRVETDNRAGVLKPGMPVEVAFGPRGGQ
jgi:HlyD family secretion protein